MVWPRSCLALWAMSLVVLLCQHTALARISPAQVFVSSADQPVRAQASSKTPPSWIIGDVLVASHNEVGFPRVDVLDPTDLSIKDTFDLVPACGGQSKTHGMSFSPRFSPLKLQLAVSCADDKEDGKVVFIAATSTDHAIRRVVPVQSAAASLYNRTGDFFVLGTQGTTQRSSGQQAATRKLSSVNSTAGTGLNNAAAATAKEMVDIINNNTMSQTPAKATKRSSGGLAPVLLALKAGSTWTAEYADEEQVQQAEPAAAGPEAAVAAALPSWIPNASDISMDLGPLGQKLHYVMGKNILRTVDTATGRTLPDRQLPDGKCSALVAQLDGSLFIACSRCLYHLPAVGSAPLKQSCLDIPAPFRRSMAIDPTGSHLLVSTTDGSLYSISTADLQPITHTSLPGRFIGGVAVLGTLAANQQDCAPGSGCCPYGRVLPQGATCRKASSECTEDAQCDGTSPECPEHPVKILGSICRHLRAPCEEPAACDGVTGICPPNPVKASGTPCVDGQSDNTCASAGACDGASGSCQANGKRNDGDMCVWKPDDDFNIFQKEARTTRIATLATSIPPSLQHAAVGALRSLVKHGRRPLAQTSMDAAHASYWGGFGRAKALSVCEGRCASSKCVMTVAKKGCCILPGSRLEDDIKDSPNQPSGSKRQQHHHKRPRGTEEDIYCWD